MVKASAGGGGKGMRLVREEKELAQGDRAGARRGQASRSATTRLYVEKFVEQPRHIEIQVLADSTATRSTSSSASARSSAATRR